MERVLLVEDDDALTRSLRNALTGRYGEVRACRSLAEVPAVLADWWPDLVLLDVILPDGDALRVLELLEGRDPAPVIIAMSGAACPQQSFALAARGARAFAAKPLTLQRLEALIAEALVTPPDFGPVLKQAIGHVGLGDVQERVRATMIDQALSRSGGSLRGAARLLAMSRQHLQYTLRRRR